MKSFALVAVALVSSLNLAHAGEEFLLCRSWNRYIDKKGEDRATANPIRATVRIPAENPLEQTTAEWKDGGLVFQASITPGINSANIAVYATGKFSNPAGGLIGYAHATLPAMIPSEAHLGAKSIEVAAMTPQIDNGLGTTYLTIAQCWRCPAVDEASLPQECVSPRK